MGKNTKQRNPKDLVVKFNAIGLFNDVLPLNMDYFDGYRASLKKLRDIGVIIIEPLPINNQIKRTNMDLNFHELSKDWEEDLQNDAWQPDTLEYTKTEKKIIDELKTFLPRHIGAYDWNLPYADAILLIFRRHLNPE